MKIYKKELTTNKGGKSRLFLVLGKSELEVIVAVITKALQYFPNTPKFCQDHTRLSNMVKVGNKALNNWDDL